MALLAILLRQLGIAEIEPHPEPDREVEQRAALRPRHLALEEPVDLLLVGHPIAREEGRQREFGKYDKTGARSVRLPQQRHQAPDDGAARVGEVDRTELCDGGFQFPGHANSPSIPNPQQFSLSAPGGGEGLCVGFGDHTSAEPVSATKASSGTGECKGFAASDRAQGRKVPLPRSAVSFPSSTTMRPRLNTVTGQPRSL